jgi:hypothetical protein
MDAFPIHARREGEFFLSLFYLQFSNFHLLLTRPSHRMTPALLSHLLLVNLRTRRDNGLAVRRLPERIIR